MSAGPAGCGSARRQARADEAWGGRGTPVSPAGQRPSGTPTGWGLFPAAAEAAPAPPSGAGGAPGELEFQSVGLQICGGTVRALAPAPAGPLPLGKLGAEGSTARWVWTGRTVLTRKWFPLRRGRPLLPARSEGYPSALRAELAASHRPLQVPLFTGEPLQAA